MACLALICLSLAACTRASVPFTVLPATVTGAGFASPTPVSPTRTIPAGPPPGFAYAVVWLPSGEMMAVRQPAGSAGAQVGELASDQRGIQLTGSSTFLGSSTWVEIVAPGVMGWINSWYLTEEVSPTDFCADPQVVEMLSRFVDAIARRDGPALAQVVSPRRGLILRYAWRAPEVAVSAESVASLFVSQQQYEWAESEGTQVRGTFAEVIVPLLDDVLLQGPEVTCNSLRAGTTGAEVRWPSEYTNLNFQSYFRPDPQPGSLYNWRTWTVGIEYVGGRPYVAVLVMYRGEI